MPEVFGSFGISTVAVKPSPDTTGLSLTVATGDGAQFPTLNAGDYFYAVVCPSRAPTRANAEPIKITARAGDVFTIGQRDVDGYGPRAIAVGDLIWEATPAATFNKLRDTVISQPGILANGTFGLWLRGITFTGSGKGPDPWQREANGTSTLQVDRAAGFSPGGSQYCLQGTYVHGTLASRVFQAYQDWSQSRGKTVTFRAYVKTAVAASCRLAIYDGVGRTYSSYHTGGGAAEQLAVTRLVDAAGTLLHFELWFSVTGTHSMDAADAFPYEIPLAMEFWETTPLIAKLEVHKYYQQLPINIRLEAQQNNQTFIVPIPYLRDMFGTPVASVFTAGTRTNLYGTPVYTPVDSYGASVTFVSAAPGPVSISGEVLALESYT